MLSVKVLVVRKLVGCRMEGMKDTNISQKDFFTLRVIKALQGIQKSNPHGSKAHKAAYVRICEIARHYGVGEHFNPSDY